MSHIKIMNSFLVFVALSLSTRSELNAQILQLEQTPITADYAPQSSTKRTSGRIFKVGLFLPFFKDGGDTTALQHAFALSSLDYLAGVRVAIDSIEKTGDVAIEFYVEDTELDSSIVESLLWRDDYRDLDVLIGPIFQSGIEMALPIIQKRKTVLYLPFEKDFKFKDLQHFISSQKNTAASAAYFSSYFLKNFNAQRKNFILIYNSKEGKYGREAREMDSLIGVSLAKEVDTTNIKTIDLSRKENEKAIAKLSSTKKYVFFINTKNSFYANEALAQIKLLKSNAPEIYCFFEILESEIPAYETWDTLSVKFFSRFFVNFEDVPTGALRKKIINSYNQDPVEFTYKGYNDIWFLAHAFVNGDNWLPKSLENEYTNEVSGYYYYQDSTTGGIYNSYHAVWRYEKLKLFRQY